MRFSWAPLRSGPAGPGTFCKIECLLPGCDASGKPRLLHSGKKASENRAGGQVQLPDQVLPGKQRGTGPSRGKIRKISIQQSIDKSFKSGIRRVLLAPVVRKGVNEDKWGEGTCVDEKPGDSPFGQLIFPARQIEQQGSHVVPDQFADKPRIPVGEPQPPAHGKQKRGGGLGMTVKTDPAASVLGAHQGFSRIVK